MIKSRWKGYEIDSSEGYYGFTSDVTDTEERWRLLNKVFASPLLWNKAAFNMTGRNDHPLIYLQLRVYFLRFHMYLPLYFLYESNLFFPRQTPCSNMKHLIAQVLKPSQQYSTNAYARPNGKRRSKFNRYEISTICHG